MKRKSLSKLALHRETLRQLNSRALAKAAGGASLACDTVPRTCADVCTLHCTLSCHFSCVSVCLQC
jgi:hypothetical protein